jgi:hypothetical protein
MRHGDRLRERSPHVQDLATGPDLRPRPRIDPRGAPRPGVRQSRRPSAALAISPDAVREWGRPRPSRIRGCTGPGRSRKVFLTSNHKALPRQRSQHGETDDGRLTQAKDEGSCQEGVVCAATATPVRPVLGFPSTRNRRPRPTTTRDRFDSFPLRRKRGLIRPVLPDLDHLLRGTKPCPRFPEE